MAGECEVVDNGHSELNGLVLKDKHIINGNKADVENVNGEIGPEEDSITIKVYNRRWYIIILFAFYPFMNSVVVATWGPIASSAHTAFGFTAADIALASTAGTLGYIPSFPLYSWMLNKHGIRPVMLLGVSLFLIGSNIRLLVGISNSFVWCIHVGQFIISLSTPISLAVPPALISVWVPNRQRVTITNLLMLMAALGGAINGVLGPQVVREIEPVSVNSTTSYSPETNQTLCVSGACSIETHDFAIAGLTAFDIKNDILILLGIQNIPILICSVLVYIYFPNKPPHPPSKSASFPRLHIKAGLKELRRNGWFWLITMAACLPNACFTTLIIMLEPVLALLKYSQNMVGWMIFTALMSAIIVPVALGRVVDKFKDHVKIMLVVLISIFALSFVWLSLQCSEIISHNTGTIFTNVILSSMVAGTIYPLTVDVTCEIAYPVSEGLVMGVFQLMQVLGLCIILGSVMIPGFVVTWVVWMTLAFVTLAIPLFALCKMELKRHELDKAELENSTQEPLRKLENESSPTSV